MAFNRTETWDSTGSSWQDFTFSNACGIHLQLVDGVSWILHVAIDCSGQHPIVCYPVWNPAEPAVQSIDENTTRWIQYCVFERRNRRTIVVNVQASHCRLQPNTSTVHQDCRSSKNRRSCILVSSKTNMRFAIQEPAETPVLWKRPADIMSTSTTSRTVDQWQHQPNSLHYTRRRRMCSKHISMPCTLLQSITQAKQNLMGYDTDEEYQFTSNTVNTKQKPEVLSLSLPWN